MSVVLTIDPGLDGGICVLNKDKEVLFLDVMPLIGDEINIPQLISLVRELTYAHKVKLAILERSECRPGQSAQSGLKTGRNYGILEGIVATLAIPYKEVRPRQWSKDLSPIKKKEGMKPSEIYKARKDRNTREAQKLFPQLDLRANERCKVPHLGKVDALLIANFGLSLI